MTNQAETRAQEVARVRSYLTTQAAKWAPAEIVERVRASQAAVIEAAGHVPAERFNEAPRAGEWSAAEVLYHVVAVVGDSSRAIVSTLRTGVPSRVRPDRIDRLERAVSLDEARRLIEAEREELYRVVLAADPEARLDVTVFTHPEFGAFNWREALLFVRVH